LLCTVEILSIGNELLLGNTVNTNASWLATQLTSLGASVTRITTVPDGLAEISVEIRKSIGRRPNFLITTGGIGPTFDDMTLAAVARAFNMPLKVNETALAMVREHYARRFPNRKVSLTKPRVKMARIPSPAIPVRNPVGTAPAVRLSAKGTQIFCLPGVPKEAKAIFRQTISKVIGASSGGRIFKERWLKVHGVMESTLAPIIDRVMAKWHGVYIKSHPRGVEANGRPHLEMHLSITTRDPKKAERMLLGASRELAIQLESFGARISLMK
jgi:molybdenum cofactor synthesis domain-containing protein